MSLIAIESIFIAIALIALSPLILIAICTPIQRKSEPQRPTREEMSERLFKTESLKQKVVDNLRFLSLPAAIWLVYSMHLSNGQFWRCVGVGVLYWFVFVYKTNGEYSAYVEKHGTLP